MIGNVNNTNAKGEFITQSIKNKCVAFIWGNKKYQIKCDRSDVFQRMFVIFRDNTMKAEPIEPEIYGLSPQHNDAVIFSLKQNRILDELKSGWDALKDAVIFADVFNCREFRQKLLAYFASEFLMDKELSIEEIKVMLTFFDGRGLNDFKAQLISSAKFYHKKWDDDLEVEYVSIFGKNSRDLGGLNPDYPINEERGKHFAWLLPFIGPSRMLTLCKAITESNTFAFRMSTIDYPLSVFEYFYHGGSADKLLETKSDDLATLRILQNYKLLWDFKKCGGKVEDFYKHKLHPGQICYILKNVHHLQNFVDKGGSLEKLYTMSAGRIDILLRYASNIPTFIKEGGTWNDLYENVKADTAVEELLRHADKIHAFKAFGGKLEDLYDLPKEECTVDGAKVGALFRNLKYFQAWKDLGRDIQEFYTVDIRVICQVLENLSLLQNAGLDFSDLLKMKGDKLRDKISEIKGEKW